MTKQERISELQARKAKADALGQDAIQTAQELYEQICDELYRLQLLDKDPVQLLTVAMDEIGQMVWPDGDSLGDCAKFFPRYTRDISDLEKLLTEANNRGHPEAFRWYLPLYRRAWQRLNAIANERLELERTMDNDGCRDEYGPTPFDSKSL